MKVREMPGILFSTIFEVFVVIVAASTTLVWNCVKRTRLSHILLKNTRRFGRAK